MTGKRLKWEPVGKVEKKYHTPLGAVFQLPGYRPDDFSVNVNGLYVKIFSDEFDAVKCKSRFIAIDFSARLFPEKLPEKGVFPGDVFLGWGSNGAGIFTIYDLITAFGAGGLHVNDAIAFQTKAGFCRSGVEYPYGIKSPADPFKLYTFRHIIDAKGKYQFFINGDWGKCMVELPDIKLNNGMIYHAKARKLQPFKVNSFCLYSDRKLQLELSDPVVYFADEWEDLKKLPALSCREYPYRGYRDFPLKETRRNPDAWYAEAMEILYGSRRETHPQEGIKLLEKAARKDHALAEYQLGLCYYRGIGVEQDFKTAGKHLRQAFESKIGDAGKVLMYMKCLNAWPHSIGVKPEDAALLDPARELELDWIKYASIKRRFQVARLRYDAAPDRKIHTNAPNKANFNRDIGALSKEWMAEMEDYAPALLFMARRTVAQSPEKAVEYLRKGEKLGSRECRLLHLQLRHRSKSLTLDEIMPADYAELLEYPDFRQIVHDLKFPGKNDPEFRAGAELLGKFMEARRDWNNLFKPLSAEDRQNLREAQRQLTGSFDLGNREAGYLLALLAMRWHLIPQNIHEIESWLQQVDDSGAALLKSEFLIQHGRDDEALSLLNRFSSENTVPVCEALIHFYLRKNLAQQVLESCRKAIAAGSVEAYRMLANASQSGMGMPRNMELSNTSWRKFIELDTARRNQEIFDLDYCKFGMDKLLPDETTGLPGGWHFKDMTLEEAGKCLNQF